VEAGIAPTAAAAEWDTLRAERAKAMETAALATIEVSQSSQ
jgi:hypothetical protein